jgi:hypothetical protein
VPNTKLRAIDMPIIPKTQVLFELARVPLLARKRCGGNKSFVKAATGGRSPSQPVTTTCFYTNSIISLYRRCYMTVNLLGTVKLGGDSAGSGSNVEKDMESLMQGAKNRNRAAGCMKIHHKAAPHAFFCSDQQYTGRFLLVCC